MRPARQIEVRRHVDRAQVAHRDLVGAGVERDLGAEVRAVDDADVLLRAPQVARILERDPRMPRLEEHREHLAPELHRRDLLEELELAARGLRFVLDVGLLERLADTCRAGRERRRARTASTRRSP